MQQTETTKTETTKTEPIWDREMEMVAYAVIHKNLWRFSGDYEPEDLLQEGWTVFDRARARYTEYNATFSQKQFICYFRSAFFRFLLDKAKYDHRRRLGMPITTDISEAVEPGREDTRVEDEEAESEFDLLLSSAPRDIQLLAHRILEEDPDGKLDNADLASLAGVPPSHVRRIRNAFGRLFGISGGIPSR